MGRGRESEVFGKQIARFGRDQIYKSNLLIKFTKSISDTILSDYQAHIDELCHPHTYTLIGRKVWWTKLNFLG